MKKELTDKDILKLAEVAKALPIEQIAHYFQLPIECFLNHCKKNPKILEIIYKARADKIYDVVKKHDSKIESEDLTAIETFLKTQAHYHQAYDKDEAILSVIKSTDKSKDEIAEKKKYMRYKKYEVEFEEFLKSKGEKII